MHYWLANVWILSRKELKSLLGDKVLMVMIVVILSIAVYSVATGLSTEVRNASVAIIDGDQSALSYRIRDALHLPYFKQPVDIKHEALDALMDKGEFVFVLDIPPNFARDILANRSPHMQILADATSITQSGIGIYYLEQIINREVQQYLNAVSPETLLPLEPVVSIMFNPNSASEWYLAITEVVSNITLLIIVLSGAAVIREREHGTIEHLLVMPVRASEIAMAKIITNGLVIAIAGLLSLWLVVNIWMQVPINGSVPLFTLGMLIYLFSVGSLGIWLATIAPTMPQFGLLCVPVYVVIRLLSGAESPIESMPVVLQHLSQWSPATQFLQYSQDVLFRNAELSIVWTTLLIMMVMGGVFLIFALHHFRSMLDRQG